MLRRCFQNEKLLSLWQFLWASFMSMFSGCLSRVWGWQGGWESSSWLCPTLHRAVLEPRVSEAGQVHLWAKQREKCHTSEVNQQGRANFDSYAKVIWIRQSFDDYKAGLGVPVGADFPVICSFKNFFTLGRNNEKMAFWQTHVLDSELPRNAENWPGKILKKK